MKKYLLFLFLAFSATAVHAEFNKLVFRTIDGKEQSVGITGLSISFSNGEMVVSTEGESVRLPLVSLLSMEFANDATGIENVLQGENFAGKITAYSVDGKFTGNFGSLTETLNALPEGLHILKAENGRTYRILINR